MTGIGFLSSSVVTSVGFLFFGIIILIVFFFILVFNGLMVLINNIDKAWANIDVLLKKRLDLIPNLVEVVKGYTKYEQSILEKITNIRASALKEKGIPEKAQDSDAISTSLKSIFLLAEEYPDLKASDNFLNLQKEITSIENQIAQRREFYNDSVLLYNTKLVVIPDRFVASILRFRPKEYFRVTEDVETPVRVTITNGSQ